MNNERGKVVVQKGPVKEEGSSGDSWRGRLDCSMQMIGEKKGNYNK